MRLNLQCHPDTPSSVARAIEVQLCFPEPRKLRLSYEVYGDPWELVIPSTKEAVRTDSLWESTCFELFVLQGDGDAYCEYNFSPSSQWAAYTFLDYRSGMAELPLGRGPAIQLQTTKDGIAMDVTIDADKNWIATGNYSGISVVVKALDGSTSYWALAHPEGSPDFHHRDCFVHELKAR
ncbi:DOMON-like domain-containing protein [Parasphingorhabdus sp.]|uniref:DOMON-like domain-containing protein n=1 Tax=Parasphingorhabdus sp. TaxID=2709688 RepID=UPI003267A937